MHVSHGRVGTVSESYEVLAVRYGTRQASAADVFLSFGAYGEPDRPLGMDYCSRTTRRPLRSATCARCAPPGG